MNVLPGGILYPKNRPYLSKLHCEVTPDFADPQIDYVLKLNTLLKTPMCPFGVA